MGLRTFLVRLSVRPFIQSSVRPVVRPSVRRSVRPKILKVLLNVYMTILTHLSSNYNASLTVICARPAIRPSSPKYKIVEYVIAIDNESEYPAADMNTMNDT